MIHIIEKLKEALADSPKERVSPILIAEKLNVDEKTALDICLSLVKAGLVSVRYEITCPECSSDVIVVDSLRKLPKNYFVCDVCGERFIPSPDDVWTVFDFSQL